MLIVEDEPLIAMQLEELLTEFRCLCASVTGVAQSFEMLEKIHFNAAFLDLNLGGQSSLPVAEALRARGTPFAFITGYADAELPSELAAVPIIAKPFTEVEVERCLRAMAIS